MLQKINQRLLLGVCFIISFSLSLELRSQDISFEEIDSHTQSSFRALSVIDDLHAWVCGSKGWYGRTRDGGQNWEFDQLELFKELDFRTLYALDPFNAIVVNAGSPTYILRTSDGGENWLPVYQNAHEDIFLDGIDFWDDLNGIIYGDPIDGKMTILRTFDGGYTWIPLEEVLRPDLVDGEASFAASGTGIRCFGNNSAAIISGGKVSRIHISSDRGQSWKSSELPIIQGQSSEGAYSIAISNTSQMIIVGGDYSKEEAVGDHVFLSNNGGKKWKKPSIETLGYRECVEYLDENSLITTGPSGTEISNDNGETWQAVQDRMGMHVVRKARNGNLIIMAGGDGIIQLVK